jgi:hypothetical protein
MTSKSADARPDIRRYLLTFAVQLALVGVAILVSRLDVSGMTREAVVMCVAAANAVVIATELMGIRRDG